VSPFLNIDTAADYCEHASKQFRSRVLQMNALYMHRIRVNFDSKQEK
jgi:hypothetical protein